MEQELIIVPIGPEHDKKSFDCGKRGLNGFLQNRALSGMSGNTYVLVPELTSKEIIAFFTIRNMSRGLSPLGDMGNAHPV